MYYLPQPIGHRCVNLFKSLQKILDIFQAVSNCFYVLLYVSNSTKILKIHIYVMNMLSNIKPVRVRSAQKIAFFVI